MHNKVVRKLFRTKALSVDDEQKTITFRISDDQADRMGERVDQDSWQLDNYNENPIVLWGHNPGEPENVLGTTQEFVGGLKDKAGKYSTAKIKFDTDINPKAGLVYQQAKRGTLRTTSIGFIPHTEEMADDTPVLKDNELMEISVVPIPANPRAIALEYKAGAISRKDANWMLESMTKEAEFLKEELENDNVNEDPEMNEQLTKTLGTMMDAITQMANGQEQTNKRLDDLVANLSTKGSTSLPCAPEDRAWDAGEAKKAIKAWASDSDGKIDFAKYGKAFFSGSGDKQGDYKLPFADIIDGKLTAVWHGVEAAYAAVKGARGGTDDIDESAVLGQIKTYYKKFGKDWPEKAMDLEDVHTKDASDDDTTDDSASDDSTDTDTTTDSDTTSTDTSSDADDTTTDDTSDADDSTDDAAKGGDNDQPGAATDDDLDLDPEAELTPELKAQIDGAQETDDTDNNE